MLVICFYFLADLADLMRPSLVAPVVAWLCHEDCRDNGSVIEAAGGWAGKCEWSDSRIQMTSCLQGCHLTFNSTKEHLDTYLPY